MTGYDPKRTCGIVTYIYGDQWPLRAYSSPVVATESKPFDGPSTPPFGPSRDSSAGTDGRHLLPFAGGTHGAHASNEEDKEALTWNYVALAVPCNAEHVSVAGRECNPDSF